MKHNIYSFIGSDAHNLINRTSSLKEIINNLDFKYTDEYNKNGIKMLRDKNVIFNGERVEKRKKFFSFKL